jgi:hypothetical protein
MNECITATTGHFTPAASLAALGVVLEQRKVFEPIRAQVQIEQKTVKHTPLDKLYDSFITRLSGAHGLGEINTLLRADPALQRAFGRKRCAEQSVVQQTLDACTPVQVAQMEQARDEIYRTHSRGFHHNYRADWHILDGDLCGWLCGKQAAFATKGYFANAARNRRGRQLGRVLATRYQEVVVDRLFPGNCQLHATLQTLVSAAQHTLQLTAEQRSCTLVRLDAAGGSVPNLNWLLEQGSEVLGKACSGQQSRLLATPVQQWVPDTQEPSRQIGWVCEEPSAFVRPVRRVAVRSRKANGQWGVGVLIGSLSDQVLLHLAGVPLEAAADEQMVLRAGVALSDQRGGGIETSFKGDKGLGLTKRNKKRFEAQQMVMLLGSLAHHVIVWAHQWLNAPASPEPEQAQPTRLSCREPLPHYGPLRMVRDVFHLSGFLRWDACGHLVEIVLNQDALLARRILFSLRQLLAPMHVAIHLDKI